MIRISSHIDQVGRKLREHFDQFVEKQTHRIQGSLAERLSSLRCPDHQKSPAVSTTGNTVSATPCCDKLKKMINQTFQQFKSEVES